MRVVTPQSSFATPARTFPSHTLDGKTGVRDKLRVAATWHECSRSWENTMGGVREIQDQLANYKLDHALLFLNYALGVSRESDSPGSSKSDRQSKPSVWPHIVHWLAKQLLMHASELGTTMMDWAEYQRLTNLFINLDDPITNNPDWRHANPDEFFARTLSQQIAAQERNLLQKYGIAIGLFQDIGIVQAPDAFDLREEVERELELSIETFMAMGFLTYGLQHAMVNGHRCMGTFKSSDLILAFEQGLDFCVPNTCTKYLARVSCSRDDFRQIANKPIYRVNDDEYETFSFNPLQLRPITNLSDDRYIAVDPELIIERTTFGLFYDVFAKQKTGFTERFGFAFEKYVGQLLNSVLDESDLWSAAAWEDAQRTSNSKINGGRKLCDWICLCRNHSIMIECKSLRPSLRFSTYSDSASLDDLNLRLKKALTQLSGHASDINQNKWTQHGLLPSQFIAIVVTYRRFHTANGPFCRDRVAKLLQEDGIESIPYLVLSIEELDSLVWLVEQGESIGDIVASMAYESPNAPLLPFRDKLQSRSVSTFVYSKGKKFLDGICRKGRANIG
jgi:hypothetical protein